ncbi:MAG: TIGR03936 family radical SAM-associated protein, partial [Clostridiales bacterium]|nr:TIGR03936 family radical SAM-associated protein [Clostridiales bacterium]
QRWRVKISISGRPAFLSHLDLLTAWERAFRRAGLPVLLSAGFNPHPLISWGPAHAVGVESLADYFDADMANGLAPEWIERLNASLPEGLRALSARVIDPRTPALSAMLDTAAYLVTLDGITEEALAAGVKALLAEETHAVERVSPKGRKVFDLRPGLRFLRAEGSRLLMSVAIGPQGYARPQEVAAAAAPQGRVLSICRLGLSVDGMEP